MSAKKLRNGMSSFLDAKVERNGMEQEGVRKNETEWEEMKRNWMTWHERKIKLLISKCGKEYQVVEERGGVRINGRE